jgi:glutathione S-transferase
MASEIYPMVEISDYPDRFAPAGEQSEALRQKARERIRDRLLLVERQVAGPWFLPSGFSILDIYAAMFSRWRGSIGKEWLEQGHIPNLLALGHAVSERPRIAPVWERHFKR